MHVLVTGANRGIGLEFVKKYLALGWQVTATAREPESALSLQSIAQNESRLQVLKLDIASDDSISALVKSLDGQPIDLLLNNAGVYGPKGLSLGDVDRQTWLEVLNINTVGPLLLVQALLENLQQGESKTVAILSSKVGSIADNGSGAGYIYRSSKTALNQVIKSLSIDLAPAGIKAIALHPGWVKTEMGGPNALIDTKTSVNGLVKVIEDLAEEQAGLFYDYQGLQIPW